jgi:NOL1/NOP2/sun family putative RNA methylase
MNEFLARLQSILPEDNYNQIVDSFSTPHKLGVRLNTLKTQDKSILEELIQNNLEPTPYANIFLTLPEHKDTLTHSKEFEQGLFYIQSLSSMLPVLLLDVKPGQEILDLCAAPGSKTSLLATLINNNGHIAAVERNKKRYYRLKDNLQRQGVTCVKTFLRDGKTVYRHCENKFDRVLVDAPCSSETRFDFNDEHTTKFWDEKHMKRNARDQWQLLYSGFVSLKPGGLLIYSTCTFAPEENEAVINKLIKKFGDDAQILPLDIPFNNIQSGLIEWQGKTFHPDVGKCLRILPNKDMEGFFLCAIKKN